ncbi:hypothetical protein JCM10212_002648 [Sporobolomyces blumeae]
MNSSILPAPLHLRPRSVRPVSRETARAHLAEFLQSDSSALLSGSGALRASLQRLVQGLDDHLEAAAVDDEATLKRETVDGETDSDKKKKRRKSDKLADGENKKRRKV